jgi:asparagine synthase (glutamine-hydrolysing)
MCGIAGILDFNNKSIKKNEIQSMIDSISHRGPDGEGTFLEDSVGLGHKRLSIFDLSMAGKQPMKSSDDRFIITFNGEVYNWPEIRKQLKKSNWISKTDTETILHAFIEFGPECLKLFNGMFAFAIWDKKEKKLFLARDRVGIKPLYYGNYKGRFYFGSEIKALFAAKFPREPNYEIVNDFLQWGLIDHSNETFFKGVKSLKPGCYMEINLQGEVRTKTYWDLVSIVNNRKVIDTSDAIVEYKNLLQDSIALRVRGDVPVGVFLSGGIDSSILAAQLVKNNTVKDLEAYTYDFKTSNAGEGKYASEVAKWLGLKQKISNLDYKEIPNYFSKVLFHEEMPITSLRVVAAHKLYEEFAPTGSTVVLEGHGGDHVGAGFEYYFMAHLLDLIKREGTLSAYSSMQKYMDIYNIPENKKLEKLFNVIGAINRIGSSTQDGVPFVKNNCLNEEFITSQISSRIEFPRPFSSHLLNAQYIDLFFHNMPRVLRYADRGSMAVGREARVPILDHRIIEFCFCTTENARINNNQQRYFMRKATEEFLPKKILQRPKRSIVDPQKHWLQNELKDWVMDVFTSKSFRERGIFNQSEVMNEYKNFCLSEKPATGFHIFQYLNVELWFREMIEKPYSP